MAGSDSPSLRSDAATLAASRRDRRQLRNKLLEPRLQLRYGAYFFLFSAGAILLACTVILGSAREVLGRVLTQAGPEAAALRGIIEDAVFTSVLQSAWLLPVFGVAGLAFGVLVTHRILGPLVPIRRQIDRLRQGDYDARCELRSGDELQDVADRLNELGAALRERRARSGASAGEAAEPGDADSPAPGIDAAPGDPPEPPRGRRRGGEEGFSVIELLVVLTLVSVLGMLAVSQLIRAFDRSRQRATLADMRSVGVASETYRVDNGEYADALSDLEPYYTQKVPPVDRWGYAWAYSGGEDYTLTSYGTDGVAGPAPPDPWHDEPFEPDLVLRSGTFVQAPGQGG